MGGQGPGPGWPRGRAQWEEGPRSAQPTSPAWPGDPFSSSRFRGPSGGAGSPGSPTQAVLAGNEDAAAQPRRHGAARSPPGPRGAPPPPRPGAAVFSEPRPFHGWQLSSPKQDAAELGAAARQLGARDTASASAAAGAPPRRRPSPPTSAGANSPRPPPPVCRRPSLFDSDLENSTPVPRGCSAGAAAAEGSGARSRHVRGRKAPGAGTFLCRGPSRPGPQTHPWQRELFPIQSHVY